MAQTIKLKRSATQNAVPSTSSLALGEIALNTYDGKLFIKKDVGGTESIVTIGAVGAGSIGPTELASTAVTAGSYGSTSAIPVITIDADGRITSASTATISGLSANSVTSTEIAANAVGISELDVTDGTDGQVLTTDGSGTLTFEDQSGGAASANAFATNIANGDGSTATFTLSSTPSAESKIIAFINGVFQNQDAYTISGTDITFDTAPISGTNNVVVYVIGDVFSGESVLISNFDGDSSTTAFTLSNNPGNENNTQVYIDGVYQQKTTYSVSGTTLTFSSAPPTGTANIEVVMLTSTTVNTPAAGSVVTASMADDSVTGAKIVSSAVTTAKIADVNVTTAKIADANVTTAKIADDAVTIGKIADAALVIESEGISSNDNDTTLPTSAAVKDYVDTQVAGKDALSELSGDTDDVTEGSTNLYFTNARADARITNALKDEDNMASNSATHIPSQQSVKAYVDSQVASKDALSELSGDTDDVSEGSSNLYYTDARVGTYISGNRTYGNITTTGYLAGPSTFTIDPAAVGDNTGTVVIAGNLQVDGTTTTINSTTMSVDDLNITLASGAANAAAANGAGITVDGASATITYDGTNDEWDFNKDINVTGTVTFDGGTTSADINFGDNDKAIFGAGSDLQIYHVSADNSSYIRELGAGNLKILGDNVQIMNAAGTENQIFSASDGSVYLYHNGVSKFETILTGINVTGTATMDGLTVDGNSTFNTSSTLFANLNYSGSNLGKLSTDGVNLNVEATSNLFLKVNSATRAKFDGNGDISFYEDTGTTAKFFWDASTERLGLGTTSPGRPLHLNIGTNNTAALFQSTDTEVALEFTDPAGTAYFRASGDYIKMGATQSDSLTILAGGNVGIGTDDPATKLQIVGSTNSAASSGGTLGIRQKGDGGGDGITITSSHANSGRIFKDASGNLHIYNTGGNQNDFVIQNTGNVGIGTDSPAAVLHISKDVGNTELEALRLSNFDPDQSNGQVDHAVSLSFELPANDGGNTDGKLAAKIVGTAGANGLNDWHTGSPSTNFQGQLDFYTRNDDVLTNQMTINEHGYVGIGTTNPAAKLAFGGLGQIWVNNDASNPFGIDTVSGELRLFTGNSDAYQMKFGKMATDGTTFTSHLTIGDDGSNRGYVGIGTDSPRTQTHILGTGQLTANITDAGSQGGTLTLSQNSNSAGSGGALLFAALNDSGNYKPQAGIKSLLSNGGGQGVGALAFSTRASTSATELTEAMRIDSSGNVGIGTANPVSAGSGTKSLHVSALGEARLVLSGDSNNSGDTGQLDAAIYMLTDGSGVGTDPFGDASATNAGAHGYSFRVKNYSGDNTFDMIEEENGTATNLIHMNTAGDVVFGYGSTSVSAGAKFEVASTTSMVIPKGTTAQRPGTAVSGAVRFNTTLGNLEQYDGSSWKMVSTVYGIDYLVLGGGGSGGDCTSPARFGGGGGAGGLRTSYGTVSGRASTAENPLMVTSGHTLTITVGAGASGGVTTDNTPGTQGSSSSITGTSGITTITALGGGGGGANTTDGSSGGSGGGGSESDGVGRSGTIGQGFDGGTGTESGDRGGGGGGTGANGTGTDGGAGTSVSITGSAVTYGGGGATSGSGGSGGGGAGSTNGTANLGGGGGAAGSQTGAGGSGVVILRIPTANYSGTTTGSPTVTTNGDFTVIKFTSSGTYTT